MSHCFFYCLYCKNVCIKPYEDSFTFDGSPLLKCFNCDNKIDISIDLLRQEYIINNKKCRESDCWCLTNPGNTLCELHTRFKLCNLCREHTPLSKIPKQKCTSCAGDLYLCTDCDTQMKSINLTKHIGCVPCSAARCTSFSTYLVMCPYENCKVNDTFRPVCKYHRNPYHPGCRICPYPECKNHINGYCLLPVEWAYENQTMICDQCLLYHIDSEHKCDPTCYRCCTFYVNCKECAIKTKCCVTHSKVETTCPPACPKCSYYRKDKKEKCENTHHMDFRKLCVSCHKFFLLCATHKEEEKCSTCTNQTS